MLVKRESLRILCVDDDPETSEWITMVLAGRGMNYHIIAAKTGREAFTALMNERFDLCITEYTLPDMTGVQLCALVRSQGKSLPIMFFSALDRPIDIAKAKAAGADEYLSKPADMSIFPVVVSHLLTRRRPLYFKPIGFSRPTKKEGRVAATREPRTIHT